MKVGDLVTDVSALTRMPRYGIIIHIFRTPLAFYKVMWCDSSIDDNYNSYDLEVVK